MDILTGTVLVVRLLSAATDLAAQAQKAGAIVGRAQQEGGRAFTDDEKAQLRALDDAAARIEAAAIARAELKEAARVDRGSAVEK